MILSLEGDTATWKSTILYSAPLPLVCFAFDAGTTRSIYGSGAYMFRGVDVKIMEYPHLIEDLGMHQELWHRNEGRAITVYMLPRPLQVSVRLQGLRILWNQFVKLSATAIKDRELPSIGVDTMTLARRIASDAYLETLQSMPKTSDRVQLIEIEWGHANDDLGGFYTESQNMVESMLIQGKQKHLIATHHLTERRKDVIDRNGEKQSMILMDAQNNPLQDMEGLKRTPKYVDVQMRMHKERMRDNTTQQTLTVVQAEFIKCGYDLSLEGTLITAPTWNAIAKKLNKSIDPRIAIQLRESYE